VGVLADDSYEVPFHFTGPIDKLTFNLGPLQVCGSSLVVSAVV
jgi:hypothetical protein